MTGSRTDKTSEAETEPDSAAEFESWLRKGAHAPSPALPRVPAKGQVIGGKYRIEEELGTGGMGAVFRATHMISDKPVALKWMLRPTSDERALQRFTREARAAGRIDHPNVVDVYDIGHDGDASYLVMELLHGESLRKRLANELLAPSEVVDLLLPAMRGVAAAHREGVIHRDLKPDNIFLCRGRDGEPRPAKVLDFGISTITSPDLTNQTALTTEGTLLGTPSYMAPEQLEGATTADVRTDIYAFGVILYEALTGRVPFKSDSYLGLALAIAKGQPPKPRELRAQIPVELERVVLHAMHKDPNKRPQTIDAFIQALLPLASSPNAISDSGEHASVERVRVSLPSAPVHRLRWLAVLAIGVLAIASGWWWTRSQPQSANAPAAASESQSAAEVKRISPVAPTPVQPSAASSTKSPKPTTQPGGTPAPVVETSKTAADEAAVVPLDSAPPKAPQPGPPPAPLARKRAPREDHAPRASAKPEDQNASEPPHPPGPARRSRSGPITADEL
jgi:serine/threonine protein kinase